MRALRREAPLLLLILYGGAFSYVAFGRGVPAFDDHPGQLFRLWHALDRSLPSAAWTADWNPDWWGGYPELQFYPPGLALVGALVRVLLLWQPSVETVYRLLCALILVAPGITTYALLVRVLGDRWLALPGAFLALTLSADLRGGVETGIRWGTLTTRLGLAWLPLLALALRPWVEGGRIPRWAPPLAALAILSHPSTLPSVAALIGLAAALSLLARPERRTIWQTGATVGLTLVLTAFWSLPFAARSSWVLPLAWGDLSLGLPGDLPGRPVLLALGMTALTAWVAVGIRRRPFDALLAALPLALAALFLADVWLFPQGWLAIEPQRLLDGVVQASVWAAALGAGVIVDRLLPGPGRPPEPAPRRAAGDRRGRRPARPRGAPAHPGRLAGAGRVAHAAGGDPPSSPRPALERASGRHGPRPLSDVVAQARRQPGVVRAPQPRHQPGAPPDRPRDRERDVHRIPRRWPRASTPARRRRLPAS